MIGLKKNVVAVKDPADPVKKPVDLVRNQENVVNNLKIDKKSMIFLLKQ